VLRRKTAQQVSVKEWREGEISARAPNGNALYLSLSSPTSGGDDHDEQQQYTTTHRRLFSVAKRAALPFVGVFIVSIILRAPRHRYLIADK
jgi:hypothetical protein